MSSLSKMNSTKNLSLIHPDDVEEPITHLSNISLDSRDSIDSRDSDLYNADNVFDYYTSPESMMYNSDYNLSLKTSKFSSENSGESNSPDLLFELLNINIEEPQTEMEMTINENIKLQETLVINGINLGDGKMDYILKTSDKLMMTNAWQAITQTNNWDFVAKDIDSFMFSDDPRIEQISFKMKELGYNLHSGCSFGCTMRNMQYLAQKGEDKFKQLFKKN